MERKIAGRLASGVAQLTEDHPKVQDQGRAAHLVHDAVFNLTTEFLPDDAEAAAVVHREADGAPVAAALKGDRLYAVECLPLEGDMEPGTTRARLVRLDPKTCRVQLEAQYRPGGVMNDRVRRSTWRFQLVDDLSLTIETKTNLDEGEMDGDEKLAQSMALALGWDPVGDSAPRPSAEVVA